MNKPKLGRKPIPDKKLLIRFFIEGSIVKENGGEEACKEECISHLKKRAKKR